jgi:ankyrin repeat protein
MLHYIIDPGPGFQHALPSNRWLTLFLENGAVVDEKDIIGQTPLHIAAFGNRAEAIEILLKYGADFNSRSDNCHHFFHFCVVGNCPTPVTNSVFQGKYVFP